MHPAPSSSTATTPPQRVFLLGATGTIGQATLHALLKQGHQVVCFGRATRQVQTPALAGVTYRWGDVSDPASLARDGFAGEAFDAVVSCMASRTGAPRDAWAIDHQAQCHVLQAAKAAGVTHFVLLSAICVQKPKLAFQHAKLAFEQALINSGMRYSIVRPTAFFKSLSGQIERLRQGKPFLLFGNGELTACKPIADDDLGDYLAGCLSDHQRHNQVLPIGGPGPAITPLQQGHMLFELMGKPPKFKRVPVGLLDGIIAVLSILGHVVPTLANKAELARIGRYYATESMLVFNPNTERYDEALTPSHGLMTLRAHYAALIAQDRSVNLGDHAVF